LSARSIRAQRAVARLGWALLLAASAACTSDAGELDARERERERELVEQANDRPDASAMSPDIELELGQGELAFAPLADGETLPTVAGGQGGHHVFVSFRMRGLDPARVLIEVTTHVDGHPELELTRRGRQSFAPAEDADERDDDAGAVPATIFVYTGWPAQILDAPMHRGERARIDVELTDGNALTASASKTIAIGEPDR
jgi:hypothetical protein